MCENGKRVCKRHERRLSSLRSRGVQRVFLVLCDKPRDPCCAIARHIWPIEEAPDLSQLDCPWASAPSDQPWEGCEYFPYFGALVVQTSQARQIAS